MKITGEDWEFDLPSGLMGSAVAQPPESLSMWVARGEIVGGVRAKIIVTTAYRNRKNISAYAAGLKQDLSDPTKSVAMNVPGSYDATRFSGLLLIDEGVSENGTEHATIVIASYVKKFAILTIRTSLKDAELAKAAVDQLVVTFNISRHKGTSDLDKFLT